MAAKKVVPVVLINFTKTVEDILNYEILPLNIDCCTDDFSLMWYILHVHVPQRMYIEYVEYPTCTCTEQLYMYIVWMLNSLFRK